MTAASIVLPPKFLYIVYGDVRGLVSEHRTLSGAIRGYDRDSADCAWLGGGAYSDVRMYAWDEGAGWVAQDVIAD